MPIPAMKFAALGRLYESLSVPNQGLHCFQIAMNYTSRTACKILQRERSYRGYIEVERRVC